MNRGLRHSVIFTFRLSFSIFQSDCAQREQCEINTAELQPSISSVPHRYHGDSSSGPQAAATAEVNGYVPSDQRFVQLLCTLGAKILRALNKASMEVRTLC